MLIEHRNAPGVRLSEEVYPRMTAHLGELPATQESYAREIIVCQLNLLDLMLSGDRAVGWTGRHLATVRMLGHEWGVRRWPLDPLLTLQGKVAEEATEVLLRRSVSAHVGTDSFVTVAEVGHRFLAELFNGFQEVHKPHGYITNPEVLALTLLRGNEAPDYLSSSLAPAYGIVAFRAGGESCDKLEVEAELEPSWLAEQASAGTLFLLCDQGGYALAPAGDLGTATEFARELHARLPAGSWTGVSWRPRAEVPAGRSEAAEVLTSALASQRAPGCYELGDVLVEYAVLRHPSVSELLVKLIEPVVRSPVLLETLTALLAANGNRSKAASDLIIHRSTLDYRLGQIERLTGHAPASSRALQVLGAALTAHTGSSCILPDINSGDF